MRRSSISAAALVAAMAGSLVLAPAALAADDNRPTLRQQLPLTAAEFGKGGESCPGVPSDKDGWHFVLPGNKADFVELKVTFEPGGTQVVTDFSGFGNPQGKHAYVASQPGAELQKVEAVITGGPLPGKGNKFPLSHTCPATETGGTTGGTTGETTTGGSTGETTTGGSTGETTTGGTTGETTTGGTTGETTTGGATTGETTTGGTTGETTTGGTTGETTTGGTTGETTTGGATTGETTGETTTGGATTGETTGGEATTGGSGGTDEGNLAETGSGAPVGVIAATALALAAAGAVLVTRRRKAQQG
ncbi:LPXTG cell wall anchor domain-containing protein [Streptomyces cinereoruber]|uniref:LPXTG cell wall anchor domain-containing protein n=1 Tax=Streptomyces cinereoruber TaxID=67260 RepID=UPI00363FCAD5